jgi:uroporphyrinogen-III synthase
LRIAITRALPEAEATAERLRAMGAFPVVAPLLTIEPHSFDAKTGGVQALVFTSANGVRAFARASKARPPAYAVGDATASLARRAGFQRVKSADGDSAELTDLIKATLDPKAGQIVHISGAHVAGDIIGALADAGFKGERRVAYEAVAARELPTAYRSPLDIVVFHSARAADVFVKLGAPNAGDMKAVCMSAPVAEIASISPWKQVVVAPAPREDALLRAALASTDANA